jgi:hypothetical protein
MINTIACTPKQLPDLFKYLYDLKFAIFLWGEPGVGKSESVQQFAKKNNMLLEDIRLTQLDSPDLQGLKWVDEAAGVTKSYRPEFFPVENVPGIIFLDELTAAEPRMQATSYQLVLDRRIGLYKLPDKWMVMAAGNSPEDGAICYKMGSALSDRFVHVHVIANPQDWLEWAVENKIHPTVTSFIRVKPDFLTTVQGQAKSSQFIAPSPRSWARVSEVMYKVSDKTSNSLLINGIVGEAAAIEFIHTAEEIAELPTMEALLAPQTAKMAIKNIPMKIACLYGLAYSLASYVKTAHQIDKAMFIFDALRQVATSLPVAEIETLANEMLLGKARELNVLPDVVRGEAYKNYTPRAKQVTER